MSSVGIHYNYDEVPYPELSHVQTHPNRLAMLGRLLGMQPAAPEKCRVLEIGCATGINLLAMAAVLPASRFIGIDLSAVQIQRANEVAAVCNLPNVAFHKLDVVDVQPDLGEFDYIIAHGIFSWVPPAVQEQILDICKRNLAPQGIAYISYNAYPGWHSMEIIRNMMLYHTRNITTPEEKARQARQWIAFMAGELADKKQSGYAALFQSYAAYRKSQSDSVDQFSLLHDELEAYNQPFYFHEFIARAEQHGLQYLVETDLPTVLPNGLSAAAVQHLKQTARTTIEMEQYLDFLNNRTFRRTLLCHAEVRVDRRLSIEPLVNFYVNSTSEMGETSAEQSAQGIESFRASDGAVFTTNHPLTKAAFHYLQAVEPQPVPFRDLVRQAGAQLDKALVSEEHIMTMAGNLLQAFSYSMYLILFHSAAPPLTIHVAPYPRATALARYQAQHNLTITNLLHSQIELNPFSRLVLSLLDGQHDRGALVDELLEWVTTGQLTLPDSEHMPTHRAALQALLSAQIDQQLELLAGLGLLIDASFGG